MRRIPAQYHVSIYRAPKDPDHIVVRVWKSWWGGPGVGQLRGIKSETWTNVAGLGEIEAARAGLYDAWLAINDDLS